MNVEKIKEWAEKIGNMQYERYPRFVPTADGDPCLFNMSTWDSCGTPMCIAGHIAFEVARERWNNGELHEGVISEIAADALDVDEEQAERLFCMTNASMSFFRDVTPAWAKACMLKLAETGEVDWDGTKPSETE